MDDFAIAVGVPNYFKLIGGEANSVAAGRRPLSSMSPNFSGACDPHLSGLAAPSR